MPDAVSVPGGEPLAVLRRLRQSTAEPRPRAGERCELCAEEVPDEHGHLVDLQRRSLLCACRGCYLLFTPEGAGGGRYKAVPDRWLALPGFRLSPAQWDELQIPVNVAFFFLNSEMGRVAAFYPGPAGATESALPLDAWDDLAASNPELSTMQADVEALLVRIGRDSAAECFIVPIDACYELVGRMRMLWHGFDGGREVHDAIDEFFASAAKRAR